MLKVYAETEKFPLTTVLKEIINNVKFLQGKKNLSKIVNVFIRS